MITLSTGSLYHLGLERIFRVAQKSGFTGVELMLVSPKGDGYWDSWDFEYLKFLQEKYHVKITSLHNYSAFEKEPGDIGAIEELANKLGTTKIVIHIPRLGQDKYLKWFEQFFADSSHPKENILVENMGDEALITDWQEISGYGDVCLDICHSQKANEDVFKIIRTIKNIKHVHISNYDGKDTHRSILDNKEYFRKVLKGVSQVDWCLELSPQAFSRCDDEETIVLELIKTREFLESIGV